MAAPEAGMATSRSRARSACGSSLGPGRDGHARARGDLVALVAAARRVPEDPRALAGLGLAGWDVIPLLVLSNAGTAERGPGIRSRPRNVSAPQWRHQWSGLLRPHLNAAAQLALLLAERGDRRRQDDAQAAVRRATEAGWATSAQAVAAYLALAWVSLDQGDPRAWTVAGAGRRGRGRRGRAARPTRRGRTERAPPRRRRRLGGRT